MLANIRALRRLPLRFWRVALLHGMTGGLVNLRALSGPKDRYIALRAYYAAMTNGDASVEPPPPSIMDQLRQQQFERAYDEWRNAPGYGADPIIPGYEPPERYRPHRAA